jgi:hypothetical protein
VRGVRSRFPTALTTALLLLGSSAAALVGAEFAVRFAFRDVTTTSPIDSYFGLRWKAQHLRRNRWGYREREFDLEKTEGIYRIAAIGDSFAVGMGLLEEQRFTNLLEKYLNRGGGGFEVLQFASPGAEMYNHVKTLAENVLRAHPDFLLLQWYVNDFEFTDFGRPKAPRALIPREELHRKAFRVSALYCLLNHAWRSLQLSLGMAKKYEDYMWERFGDPESVDSQTAMRQLDVFISGAPWPSFTSACSPDARTAGSRASISLRPMRPSPGGSRRSGSIASTTIPARWATGSRPNGSSMPSRPTGSRADSRGRVMAPTRRGSIQRAAGKLSLLIGSTLLTLLVAELAFRVLDIRGYHERRRELGTQYAYILDAEKRVQNVEIQYRPYAKFGHGYDSDPEGYFDDGNQIVYALNEHGFRGGDYEREKPPRTRRIALLGDSFTFGEGVRLEDTFGYRLQEILDRDQAAVEVLSFAVGGWGM